MIDLSDGEDYMLLFQGEGTKCKIYPSDLHDHVMMTYNQIKKVIWDNRNSRINIQVNYHGLSGSYKFVVKEKENINKKLVENTLSHLLGDKLWFGPLR